MNELIKQKQQNKFTSSNSPKVTGMLKRFYTKKELISSNYFNCFIHRNEDIHNYFIHATKKHFI